MLLSACERCITQPYKCHCQPMRDVWFSLTNVTASLLEMYDSALQMLLSACEKCMSQPYKCRCQPVRDVWFSLTNVTVSLWERHHSALQMSLSACERCMIQPYKCCCQPVRMYDSALQMLLSACERCMIQPYKCCCQHVRDVWFSFTNVTVSMWEMYDSALQKSLSACERCMIQPYNSHCQHVRDVWFSLTKVTVSMWEMYDSALQKSLYDSALRKSLASLMRMISWMRWGGDLCRTVWTVLRRAESASLWKQMMMLAVGKSDSYVLLWHLHTHIETDDDAGSGQVRFIRLTVTPAHTHRNKLSTDIINLYILLWCTYTHTCKLPIQTCSIHT